ncbi:hypothetical protein WN990_31135 [Kitasatospora purpeofusca]|uniref:hypothetical protein n=1 Tax=Kitasatospora purpeofusca TaxID=67352 RepID=UPI0030F22C00
MPAESSPSADENGDGGRRAWPATWGRRFTVELVALLTVFAVLTFWLVPESLRFLSLPVAGLAIGWRWRGRSRR